MAAKKRSGHGGARKGAGRHPLFKDRQGITVQFERSDYEKLTEAAESRSISIGALIREAVARYLARPRRK